ncbi:F-box/kelch-repeat protein At3g23880-like [Arachis hypogaea]|uniref:F-box/kelch-repeat protein At3g23880-like n=1 Tax=Arachis hypogaea TaxID=3818 RepID=UPI000DECE418|nr:F-box/kelch-repeat protein At3g23880-like [Arachis hypogaea]XP_025698329.1 F-box/kelch-repeat protein At3g23880-like [Arachis hypogaea]QHO40380.1 F-box/kelch-repeat protein [Arachis hypogaea]
MRRGPIPDDDDDAVPRKGKVVTTTGGWPELLRCVTTKPPPILLDELIAEILLRIPARSLLRLRNSVCSSWRTLISSSQFAKDHLRRSMAVDPALTHPLIAYFARACEYPKIGVFSVRSVMENPPQEPTKVVSYEGRRYRIIIGSCNGLLCLHDEERGEDGFIISHRAMLWNPCTGFTSQPLEIAGVLSICGFGYDHVNDKYKLLAVVRKKSGEPVTTRMFTFGPNSTWRTIQDFPHNYFDFHSGKYLERLAGLYLSGTGTLNWLLYSYSSFVKVISLDLVKETYSQFSLPSRDSHDNLWMEPKLGILRDCLAVCYETKKTHWTVWFMKDYGVPQSWTKLTTIPHHPLLVHSPSCVALQPIYMLKDVLLAIAPSGKFVLCNLKDGSIDLPNINSSSDGMPRLLPLTQHASPRVFQLYHESLVSPSHFGLPSCSSEMRLIKPSL